MHPAWRPDWRDKKAYPTVHGTRRLQWAWEFLRRNDEYLQLWTAVVQPDFKAADLDSMWERAQRAQRAASTHRVKAYFDHRRGEFKDRFFIATFPRPPPWEKEAKLLFPYDLIHYEEATGSGPKDVIGWLWEDEIVIWFNRRWPLAPQLENARKRLQSYARSIGQRRMRVDHFANYLRILDGAYAGATVRQIADVIYRDHEHNQQRVRYELAVAKRLRDHDYWLIAESAKR